MHPALIRLVRLRLAGLGRRFSRSMGTVPGLTLLGLGVMVVAFWVTPLFLVDRGLPRLDTSTVADMLGPGLLAACILTVVLGDDKVMRFSPAEVAFLFPGPFTRRELMGYKLFENILGAAFASLFFFVWLVPHVPLVGAAYWGTFQAMLFIQLFQVAVTLGGQTIAVRAQTIPRGVVIAALAALAVLLVWQTSLWMGTHTEGGLWRGFRDSTLGGTLLALFDVFGKATTAASYSDLAVWGGVALAINVVLISLIIRLDEFYLETALHSSQRFLALVRRFRTGGMFSVWGSSLRWRVPNPGNLGGAGPVAWHQFTAAARSVPTLLSLGAVVLFILAAPQLLLDRAGASFGGTLGVTVAVVQLTIIFTFLLQFDFRSDLEQLEWLKTMPVSPFGVAVGQLALPAVLASVVQGGLIAGLALGTSDTMLARVLWAVLPFVVPLNLLLFALENFLFLVYPTRAAGFRPGDLQGFLRQIILFVVKLVLLFVGSLLATLVGVGVYLASGSILLAIFTGWATLMLQAVAVVPMVGWAYDRFDPSTDQPA